MLNLANSFIDCRTLLLFADAAGGVVTIVATGVDSLFAAAAATEAAN